MANRTVSFKTNHGTFKVELLEDSAPLTTGNFVKLAKNNPEKIKKSAEYLMPKEGK